MALKKEDTIGDMHMAIHGTRAVIGK